KRMQWFDEWSSQELRRQTEQNLPMPFITPLDAIYPQRLREIYDPPLVLYYHGNLKLLQYPCLAVVGSRNITKYGEQA
ncbi:DNA-protecting protein DprA, partial [Faecalibacterium prausnitzii]